MAKDNGFSHYTSHASDPFTATAGLAVVQTILDEGLVERSARMGQLLKGKLCKLQKRHDGIGDVRGHGLILGVEIVANRETREPGYDLIKALTKRCFELGLNINQVGGPHTVWRLAPPLTISEGEIEQAIGIIDTALTELG